MYYYGARYGVYAERSRSNPKISIFVSVDPLAEDYRGIGGYVYVANNPINLIDPDGMKIVNADKLRLASYRSKYQNYKATASYQKYSSLSRREAKKQYGKQGVAEWKNVNTSIKAYEKHISTYKDRAEKTDAIMTKWQEESPNLYKKIDEMKVDLYLGVDKNVSTRSGEAFGATGSPTMVDGKYNYSINEVSGLKSDNALPVFINRKVNISSPDYETGEYSLNHEGGHFIFAVENPEQYFKDKNSIPSKEYNGGHHPNATTGNVAREYGLKKDIE